MLFSNSGVVYRLSGSNNSFGGGVVVGNGTLYYNTIGMAGSNSSLGTNGVLQTGGSTTTAAFRWTNLTSEVSDKSINLASTTGGLSFVADGGVTASSTNAVSLTLNGGINSTVAGNKTITLAGYNSNTLTINGVINEFAGSTNNLVIGVSNDGTVVLGNTNNSFGGGVTITNSTASRTTTLSVSAIGSSGNNSPLGTNGTITMGLGSSTATAALAYTGAGETNSKAINIASVSGTFALDQSGTGNLKLTGAITSATNGTRTLRLQGSTAGTGELASNLGDLGGGVTSLNKSGTGTWTLSGSNTYSGSTTIGAGTLRLAGTNTLPTSGVLVGSSGNANASTLELATGGDYVLNSFGSSNTAGGYMNFTNSSGSAATMTFSAATNYISLSSAASGGRAVLNNSTNLTVTFNGAVDIGGSAANDVTFGGAGNTAIKGAIFNTNTSAARGLTKTGTGALTLEGANTYNGATTISAGSLIVSSNSSISSPTVSISSGATFRYNNEFTPLSATITVSGGAGRAVLGGSGTINSAVTLNNINDVLSPGESPGILSLTPNQTWSSFTYDWEINNFTGTTAGTDFDQISIGGSLDLSGSDYGLNVLSLTLGNVTGNVANFSETETTWTILSANGGITGFNASNWAIDQSGFSSSPAANGAFSLSQSGNDLLLTYTVPEPSTYALLGVSALACGAWFIRRRRKS
jgi:autotransporter-associated beta strand protein